MRGLLFLSLVVVGCQGPPGPAGPAGPAGTAGNNGTNGSNGTSPDGGVAPTTTTCTPTQPFCDGNRLWYCTKSGADAYGGNDCGSNYGSSSTNPFSCVTTGCPSGQAACCKPMKPAFITSLTGTLASSMTSYASGDVAGTSFTAPPQPIAGCNQGAFYAYLNLYNGMVCPPTSASLQITITRGTITPGQTVTLPNAGVSVNLSNSDSTKSCYQWAGSLTWDSDAPSWKITLNNLTCTGTNTSVTLNGSESGNI